MQKVLKTLISWFVTIRNNNIGSTVVEYALIILLVVLVIVSVVGIFGQQINGLLTFQFPS